MTVLRDTFTDPLTWWTILCFTVGFGLGRALDAIIYLLTGRRPNPWLMPTEPPDVELFTTTTPDAYPAGRIIRASGQHTMPDGAYAITQVVDLGSFSDITGQRHQQWRVYGRPV